MALTDGSNDLFSITMKCDRMVEDLRWSKINCLERSYAFHMINIKKETSKC